MNTETTSGFAVFGLPPVLNAALAAAEFTTPTPVQAAAIPPLLAGRDIVGIAQTGTGKTAAFALPILAHLVANPKRPEPRRARIVVLSPTRELAIQIADTFKTLSRGMRLAMATMFGGVSERPQIQAAERGIDILVATPGRLLDLVERRFLGLDRTEIFVLDEADRMLDMGFVRDVKKLTRLLPNRRQSMMFSATMPPAIREIATEMLKDPAEVSVTPEVVTVEKIEQSVYHVAAKQKRDLLLDLLVDPSLSKVVVFTRTKHAANRVAEFLDEYGVASSALHGNKSQNARQAALGQFRDGRVRVLVATDIMARGIDVPDISHVVNFELPNEPESYVHRIGRTARAGRSGLAIAFCDPSERSFLRQIERLTKVTLTVKTHAMATAAGAAEQAPPVPGRMRQQGGGRPAQGGGQREPRGYQQPRPPQGERPQHRDDRPARQERPVQPRQQREERPQQPRPQQDGMPAFITGGVKRGNRPGSRARQRQRGAA